MAVRRVFVIWSHPIFYESVRLLLNHSDVELVGATSDFAIARNEIMHLRPDTILVESAEDSTPAEVIGILGSSAWCERIFGLSLADNDLNVFHREQWTVGRSDDLLRIVLGYSL